MSLSLAMSTASDEVFEVMVARMRWAWTPWPSWTRRGGVQPDVGDVPADRLLEDGSGRGAERGALGAAREGSISS